MESTKDQDLVLCVLWPLSASSCGSSQPVCTSRKHYAAANLDHHPHEPTLAAQKGGTPCSSNGQRPPRPPNHPIVLRRIARARARARVGTVLLASSNSVSNFWKNFCRWKKCCAEIDCSGSPTRPSWPVSGAGVGLHRPAELSTGMQTKQEKHAHMKKSSQEPPKFE